MKLAVCWIAMMALAQVCFASDSESERRTLAGITAVHVLIEELPPAAGSLGLSKESVATDVARKLRQAGLRVVNNLAGSPAFLYANIVLTGDARAANIFVELHQTVQLVRDPSINPFSAVTWSEASIVANPSAIGIRKLVDEMVGEFLQAWLSVNPKVSQK